MQAAGRREEGPSSTVAQGDDQTGCALSEACESVCRQSSRGRAVRILSSLGEESRFVSWAGSSQVPAEGLRAHCRSFPATVMPARGSFKGPPWLRPRWRSAKLGRRSSGSTTSRFARVVQSGHGLTLNTKYSLCVRLKMLDLWPSSGAKLPSKPRHHQPPPATRKPCQPSHRPAGAATTR